jgi:uncharacterized protein
MLKKIIIFPIIVYQYLLSPLLGKNCRHEPTCSNYMIEAIKEWGILKGIWLGMVRLSKCHPWGTMGYDPVAKNEKNIKCNK